MTAADPRDIDAMLAAVNADPIDAATRRVYADALEDGGQDATAASQRAFADLLGLPVNADLRGRIAAAVARANGGRRARLVTAAEVADCVRSASLAPIGAAYVDGGGVANSYGYAASTALVLVVVREDGRVCVDGGEAAARKAGGSPANVWPELAPWNTQSAILPTRLAAWAAAR